MIKPATQTSDFAAAARICDDRTLPALYAVLTNLRAALYAIQAFPALVFKRIRIRSFPLTSQK
ncbi:hypothetical protein AJ88_38700 [Mesorhizobium amorphae CCBAU 01583]|nr:hypothetical protein AJ88_38700 [Mesorhizobium amorphae CCBAU 01583]